MHNASPSAESSAATSFGLALRTHFRVQLAGVAARSAMIIFGLCFLLQLASLQVSESGGPSLVMGLSLAVYGCWIGYQSARLQNATALAPFSRREASLIRSAVELISQAPQALVADQLKERTWMAAADALNRGASEHRLSWRTLTAAGVPLLASALVTAIPLFADQSQPPRVELTEVAWLASDGNVQPARLPELSGPSPHLEVLHGVRESLRIQVRSSHPEAAALTVTADGRILARLPFVLTSAKSEIATALVSSSFLRQALQNQSVEVAINVQSDGASEFIAWRLPLKARTLPSVSLRLSDRSGSQLVSNDPGDSAEPWITLGDQAEIECMVNWPSAVHPDSPTESQFRIGYRFNQEQEFLTPYAAKSDSPSFKVNETGLRAALPVGEGTLELILQDTGRLQSARLSQVPLRILGNQPPQLKVLPESHWPAIVTSEGMLPLQLRAADDYGLRWLRVTTNDSSDEAPPLLADLALTGARRAEIDQRVPAASFTKLRAIQLTLADIDGLQSTISHCPEIRVVSPEVWFSETLALVLHARSMTEATEPLENVRRFLMEVAARCRAESHFPLLEEAAQECFQAAFLLDAARLPEAKEHRRTRAMLDRLYELLMQLQMRHQTTELLLRCRTLAQQGGLEGSLSAAKEESLREGLNSLLGNPPAVLHAGSRTSFTRLDWQRDLTAAIQAVNIQRYRRCAELLLPWEQLLTGATPTRPDSPWKARIRILAFAVHQLNSRRTAGTPLNDKEHRDLLADVAERLAEIQSLSVQETASDWEALFKQWAVQLTNDQLTPTRSILPALLARAWAGEQAISPPRVKSGNDGRRLPPGELIGVLQLTQHAVAISIGESQPRWLSRSLRRLFVTDEESIERLSGPVDETGRLKVLSQQIRDAVIRSERDRYEAASLAKIRILLQSEPIREAEIGTITQEAFGRLNELAGNNVNRAPSGDNFTGGPGASGGSSAGEVLGGPGTLPVVSEEGGPLWTLSTLGGEQESDDLPFRTRGLSEEYYRVLRDFYHYRRQPQSPDLPTDSDQP